MANYNFEKDLSVAKKTEQEVADLLVKNYCVDILAFENTNKYDLLVRWWFNRQFAGDNKRHYWDIKIEIKEDFLGEITGNVAVESGCRGKPSGIETTEANYYIYKLHTKDHGIQFIMHRVETLKQMIVDKRYFRPVNGGDPGSDSMNYLFKYDVFAKTGKILQVTP